MPQTLYFRAVVQAKDGSTRNFAIGGYEDIDDLQEQVAWAMPEILRRAEGDAIVTLDRRPDVEDTEDEQWEELTTAFRLRRGQRVRFVSRRGGFFLRTFDHWRPCGNGTAYFVDTRGNAAGPFSKQHVFVLDGDMDALERHAEWERITERIRQEEAEEEAKAERDAEMAYERHLEDAGYEDARAQEDYERSLGITEFL